MGKISEIFNFDNIGGKIKSLAKWSCWITILLIWIAAPILFFVFISDRHTEEFCWIPLVSAVVGPAFIWVGSWTLYAFGEFVEDIHAMRSKEWPAEQPAQVAQAVSEPTPAQAAPAPTVQPTSPPSTLAPSTNISNWRKGQADQGVVVGKCQRCGLRKKVLVHAKYEDYFGRNVQDLCFDCFCELGATPKRKE